MIDISELENRVLALIATGTNSRGEKETAVFTGTMRRVGGSLVFDRGSNGKAFGIPSDWYERIKAVKPKVKAILLEADYCITLTVGNIEEGEKLSEYEPVGLRWPDRGPQNGTA